jgi:TonB-linked SusC/RagA family outer membrane protein
MRKLALPVKLLGLLLCFFIHVAAFAQDKTVTGTVRDANNDAVDGAAVKVVGTTTLARTNAKGEFTIKARKGQILEISFVGYESQRVTVGDGNTVSVSLKTGSKDLDEVVVVAMDMKRNPKELGYSVQKVAGAEIQETQRDNFLNSLQGRAAGLTVNPSGGAAGASSSIVLRGFNSMALDNQPLFVVDGIIMDNSTVNETSNGGSQLGLASDRANKTNDYTNRIADINPNDIESVTILKGPEATALYGSQASSGAIIITTKKGKSNGKLNLAYDNSFRFQAIGKFPETQTVYGNGQTGATTGEFLYFGPKYPAGTPIYDNIGNFFKTGFAQTHNLSADYGKKNYSFRVSGSALNQSGVVPENKYKKYSIRVTNNTKLGKYVELAPSFTYTNSSNDKPLRGANGYLLSLLAWPSHFDVRDWESPTGDKRFFLASSANGEIDNPLFSVNRNRSSDKTNRYTSTLGVNITPYSWLTINGRFGYDVYNTDGYTVYHPQSFYVTKGSGGSMDNYYRKYHGYNHTITASVKRNFGKFGVRVTPGTMWQDYKSEQYAVTGGFLVDSVNTAGQMVKNNVVVTQAEFQNWLGDSSRTRDISRTRLSNARKGLYNASISRQFAYFAEASINYNSLVFLTYTHRFELSSIFPKDYRSYNYPAGSLSLMMSDIFPEIKTANGINYWKLRGSLATTARSSSPYANQSVFNPVFSSGGGYAYAFNNNNYYLEPEIQKTFEIGTEFRLLKNKLNFDVTYYNTLCEKQIVENFRASYGTGYVLNTLNVGTTRNEGIEVALDLTAIKHKDFEWRVRLNFNRMWNEVVSLPSNVPEFYIADTWVYLNARGGLIPGGPTTAITAFGYVRNNQGKIVIDPASGLPKQDATFLGRGDRNPDFTLGTLNNFRYKNLSLSFLWDLKVGGDIFNATEMYLTSIGKSTRTLDRETPRVIEGVLGDGKENTANPTPNTIVVNPYYNNNYYKTPAMPEEEFIERDVNWFRLRDVSLSYTFSPKAIKSLSFVKSLSAFFTGNDLILITNYTGADPQASGNTAATRGVGGWGFDYGNVAVPKSFNFGLRATF